MMGWVQMFGATRSDVWPAFFACAHARVRRRERENENLTEMDRGRDREAQRERSKPAETIPGTSAYIWCAPWH